MHLNTFAASGVALSNPELRFFESGAVRCTFFLMVHTPDDPHTERPEGIEPLSELLTLSCELWGRNAQLAADYVRQGRGVSIAGRLRRSVATGAPVALVDRIDFTAGPAYARTFLDALESHEQAPLPAVAGC